MIEKFAYYRENLNELIDYSVYIKLFLTSPLKEKLNNCINKEDKNKYFVELFNNFYQTKRWFYFKVLDELLLRGVRITSNFFNISPTSNNYSEYIHTTDNNNKFLKINFSKFELDELIDYFNIKNDYFFNYIPVKSFTLFNENIDLDLLKEEFRLNGFNIVNSDETIIEINADEYNKVENESILIEEEIDITDDKLYEKLLELVNVEESIWISLELISKKLSVSKNKIQNLFKNFRNNLIVTSSYLAHIDNIYISLEEEVYIVEKLKSKVNKADLLEDVYLKDTFLRRNEFTKNDTEKVDGIIEYLIGELDEYRL